MRWGGMADTEGAAGLASAWVAAATRGVKLAPPHSRLAAPASVESVAGLDMLAPAPRNTARLPRELDPADAAP